MKITVLNPFTLDPAEHSDQTTLHCEDKSLTVQADVEASDINTIVRQFGVTGELPYGSIAPYTADLTNFPTDYHEAQNFIIQSQELFMDLPSSQRTRFDNNPGKFLDFIADDNNRDEAISLGFLPKPDPLPTDGFPVSKSGETTPTATPGVNNAAHSST